MQLAVRLLQLQPKDQRRAESLSHDCFIGGGKRGGKLTDGCGVVLHLSVQINISECRAQL